MAISGTNTPLNGTGFSPPLDLKGGSHFGTSYEAPIEASSEEGHYRRASLLGRHKIWKRKRFRRQTKEACLNLENDIEAPPSVGGLFNKNAKTEVKFAQKKV